MHSRLDIEHSVGLLSRFGAKPTLPTCKLMVYLLQYVRGTVAKGIRTSGCAFDMHIFTDADWTGDILTRRSTTGYTYGGRTYGVAVHATENCVDVLHCILPSLTC